MSEKCHKMGNKERKERKKESSAGRIFIKQTKQNKIQTITTP